MNDRGWVIYHHPLTGRWHTLREAAVLLEAGMISQVPETDGTLSSSS
jgi:mRNA-degrading endonuclease YafQ of YafQ-DinJ toxin-antitoxin module